MSEFVPIKASRTGISISGKIVVPAAIADAGEHAVRRFLEFFAATIRNKNTRMAYYRAACSFFAWLEQHDIVELADIEPLHVSLYIETLQATAAKPTVKQHLAAIRMLFDWLVIGQILATNPAHSVRGPKHENLRMGCFLGKSDARTTIERVLASFPRLTALLERARRGAAGRRAAIARARALSLRRATAGFLDEPTEGIQPSIVDEIVETLRTLRAAHNLTMILVEQDLNFIAALADRVLIIQKGVVTREVTPSDIADPALVAEFVGMGG